MGLANKEMNNFQKMVDVFKDYKDIKDIQSDLNKLDYLYQEKRYHDLNNHISEIARKYPLEVEIWNRISNHKSKAMRDIYYSARMFLYAVCCKKLIEYGIDIKDFLTAQELAYIESKIKPME